MNRKLLASLGIVALSALLMACPRSRRRRIRRHDDQDHDDAPQPTDITAPATSKPVVDKTPDPLAGDLQT